MNDADKQVYEWLILYNNCHGPLPYSSSLLYFVVDELKISSLTILSTNMFECLKSLQRVGLAKWENGYVYCTPHEIAERKCKK